MKSLIFLDNASYHNTEIDKTPTMSNRKSDMREWLKRQGIDYDDCDIKTDLMGKKVEARPR